MLCVTLAFNNSANNDELPDQSVHFSPTSKVWFSRFLRNLAVLLGLRRQKMGFSLIFQQAKRPWFFSRGRLNMNSESIYLYIYLIVIRRISCSVGWWFLMPSRRSKSCRKFVKSLSWYSLERANVAYYHLVLLSRSPMNGMFNVAMACNISPVIFFPVFWCSVITPCFPYRQGKFCIVIFVEEETAFDVLAGRLIIDDRPICVEPRKIAGRFYAPRAPMDLPRPPIIQTTPGGRGIPFTVIAENMPVVAGSAYNHGNSGYRGPVGTRAPTLASPPVAQIFPVWQGAASLNGQMVQLPMVQPQAYRSSQQNHRRSSVLDSMPFLAGGASVRLLFSSMDLFAFFSNGKPKLEKETQIKKQKRIRLW